MKIPPVTPAQRDRIIIIALLTLAVLAFPVLSSLVSAWTPAAPSVIAAAPSMTATPTSATSASPTGVPPAAPSWTPVLSATQTLAPIGSATPFATETPVPWATLTPGLASLPSPLPGSSAAPPPALPRVAEATASPTSTALPTATASPTPTPTLLPRVYLLPFRPVYLGSAPPAADAPFTLYESGSDVFRTVEQQGTFVRLQTLDGRTGFWTAAANLSPAPPAAPTYDFSVRGRTVPLSGSGYACIHEANVVPALGACQPLSTLQSATLTARVTAGSVSVYLAESGGRTYYIVTDNVL